MTAHNCASHCFECGAHFGDLAAFDAHLVRISQAPNRWGAPEYALMHELGSEVGLLPSTRSGRCSLAGEEVLEPVTIWRTIPADWGQERPARRPRYAGSGVQERPRGSKSGRAAVDAPTASQAPGGAPQPLVVTAPGEGR